MTSVVVTAPPALLPAANKASNKNRGNNDEMSRNSSPRNTTATTTLFRRCIIALLWSCCCSILSGVGRHGIIVVAALPAVDVEAAGVLFSPDWVERYHAQDTGCKFGRGSYTWRQHGFGSNINNMLDAWVYAIVVEGWSDLAVIIDSQELGAVECFEESGGHVANGWSCLFTHMPHVCTFNSPENWVASMETLGVSEEDRDTALNLTQDAVRFSEDVPDALDGLDIDQLGAMAVVAKYLWSYIAPWLKNDLDTVMHTEHVFQEAPFVGIHVRRGDKVWQGEADMIETEEYLSAAAEYLAINEEARTSVEEIKGIWVASDDPSIVEEAGTLAQAYFPNVDNQSIVSVAAGVPEGPETHGVTTHTNQQDYAQFVYLLADLQQLAAAEVFVGTYSSNVGRLVAVLREGRDKSRGSSLSLDAEKWWPGR